MRLTISLVIILFLATMVANGQKMYIRTFGSISDKSIIFLHGGPGYNCANFEATTAQKLADKGFFVIVYDRRGEGRSQGMNAKFTFRETFDDLSEIYKTYKLTSSILIGHSFGGVVATLFAEINPDKIQSVILVGAPVSLQATFKNIIARSANFYLSKKDTVNMNYVSMLKNMDTASIEYSSYCFQHAMQNGFYIPKNPSQESKAIYATFRTDTLLKKHAAQMTYQAPQGFWKNEKYTTLDLTQNITRLKQKGIKIFALYGKDDGLYSAQQITDLQSLIGSENLIYFDDCSHNVFIDQQTQFVNALINWAK